MCEDFEITPTLIDIAKAAKRKCDLSAEEMFDSLIEGIKRRGKYLRKLREYTIEMYEPGYMESIHQEYADALKVSVEKLTSDEKQIALLNYTLENG